MATVQNPYLFILFIYFHELVIVNDELM